MSATAHEVHVHRDPPEVSSSRDRMGVLLLIIADVAFVACLIFTYLYLRFLNVDGRWLPEEITPAPSGPTWIIVGVTALAAILVTIGVALSRRGNRTALTVMAVLGLIAAGVAVVLQYNQMVTFNFALAENGRYASSYSSTMVALAGANLLHLLIATFVTVGLLIRSARGRFVLAAAWQPRLINVWWIWVAVSAILVALMTTFAVASPFPPSMPPEHGG